MSGLPDVPDEFKQYNSYVTDPIFQRRFTYAWLGLLAFCVVYAGAPLTLVNALRTGRFWTGWTAYEKLGPGAYAHLNDVGGGGRGKVDAAGERSLPTTGPNAPSSSSSSRPLGVLRTTLLSARAALQTLTGLAIPIWHLPSILGEPSVAPPAGHLRRRTYVPLTVGQLILGLGYTAAVGACVFQDAALVNNANRLGFLALAQLSPLLLLATKNSPLAFVLTTSYDRLNWAHRWAGRLVWLCATAHGAIWINQMGDVATNDKMQRGLIAYGLLTAIAVTSIRPVREKLYNLFWVTHFLCFTGFFAAVAYHTTYAVPWVIPPAALYAFDLCARLVKARMVDAVLVPLESGMTLIHLPDLNRGWLPTQHVFVRVFSASWQTFEAHPLTILSSPPSAASPSSGVTLLAFSAGDWSRAVHRLAASDAPNALAKASASELEMADRGEAAEQPVKGPVMARVVLDGPHGGLGWRGLGDVDLAVCVAGGSGVSFLLGVADEAVRELAEGSQLTAVRLVWILRDLETYEAIASLFRPLLSDRITLALYLSTASTADSDDFALPSPPPSESHVTLHGQPHLDALLSQTINAERFQPTRGVRVLACGPAGLVKDVRSAVGRLGVRRRVRWGGVDFVGDGFAL